MKKVVILILIGILGAAAYTLWVQPSMEKESYVYKETNVEYGNLQVGIMESGSVEMEEEKQMYDLDLVEDSEGDTESEDDDVDVSELMKFEKVYVVVGQKVKAGDPIYQLKPSTVNTVLKKLALEAAEAETSLSEANISNSLDTLEAMNTKISDEIEGNTAQSIYDISNAKLNNEIKGYVTAIQESTANIEKYQKKIADYQKDDDHDGITNYQEVKLAFDHIAKDYENADKNNERTFVTIQDTYLTRKKAYDDMLQNIADNEEKITEEQKNIDDYLEKIRNAQAKAGVQVLTAKQLLETSELAGSIAEDTYGFSVATAKEAVTDATKQVEDANEKLEDLKNLVGEDGIIYAESDGMVTDVPYKVGDTLESNSELLSYVTESSITLSVDVSQEDIVNIAVGDGVNIQFTAYPDEEYEGTVMEITTTATSNHATTVSYPVTIKVHGDTSKLYAGMTGDVTFVTEEKDQVLYVLRKAIVEQNGKFYVYLKDKNGNMTLHKVTTGFTDGVNIEITDGLEQGDVVYIASVVSNQTEREENTKNEK